MELNFGEILSYAATAVGGGGLTALFNWRYNKKKNAAELKSDEIENIRKSLAVYQQIITDQNARIRELNDEVQQLREEKRRMEASYQKQLTEMQKQISELYRALGIQATKQVRDDKTGRYVKSEK